MFSPSGLYIVVRENIGKPGWIVRVLDFATWKHRQYEYRTEQDARQAAAFWLF